MSGPSTSETPLRTLSPSSPSSQSVNETIRSMIRTPGKRVLFDRTKDDYESKDYLDAVSEVPLGSYKRDVSSFSNMVENVEGTLLMSDMATIKRLKFDYPAVLSVDGINWCISSIMDKQHFNGRSKTTCFNVNVCLNEQSKADIERIDKSFITNCGTEINNCLFKRRYLLLPVSFENGCGLTMILNGSGRKQIYHIQIGSIPDYETQVTQKILDFLRMFLRLERYNYRRDPLANAEVHYVKLVTLGRTERAFQLLFVLSQIAKMAEQDKHYKKNMDDLSQLNENEEEFRTRLDELRTVLAHEMDRNLKGCLKSNPVGSELRERRRELELDAKKEAEEQEALEKKSSHKLTETPRKSKLTKRKRPTCSEDDDSETDEVVTPRNKSLRKATIKTGKRRFYMDCDDSSKENESE